MRKATKTQTLELYTCIVQTITEYGEYVSLGTATMWLNLASEVWKRCRLKESKDSMRKQLLSAVKKVLQAQRTKCTKDNSDRYTSNSTEIQNWKKLMSHVDKLITSLHLNYDSLMEIKCCKGAGIFGTAIFLQISV